MIAIKNSADDVLAMPPLRAISAPGKVHAKTATLLSRASAQVTDSLPPTKPLSTVLQSDYNVARHASATLRWGHPNMAVE